LPEENGPMPDMQRQLGRDGSRQGAAPRKLRHGSLFTGIGGFDLGLDWAGFETVWQVEIGDFAVRVLQKHWPDVKRSDDITKCGRHNLEPVDIISGGFPCQQISFAGKREGIGTGENPTERSGLWFEFRRIVGEMRPRWVIIENVPGLKNLGADEVLSGMEALGYACWPVVVGTDNLGAPHERKRIWVLCRRNDDGAPVQ